MTSNRAIEQSNERLFQGKEVVISLLGVPFECSSIEGSLFVMQLSLVPRLCLGMHV